MKQINSEPSSINIYMQQALRPISRKYYYSNYINSLPIKKTDKIIDFGSGIGVISKLLADKLPKGNLTCIDISERYIASAKKKLKEYSNISFLTGELSNLDLHNDEFDAINIHNVLQYIPIHNRNLMIAEMYRLLRPGGKIYIRELLKDSKSDELKSLFENNGFYLLYEEEKRIRMLGDTYSACYAKISNMQFFFS